MRRLSILWLLAALTLSAFWFLVSPGETFPTSLHATRNGKAYWYAEEQGGFYTLTGIPMEELACQKCHAATLADGTPVNSETYEPSCADCHDFTQGTAVQSSTCRGCHSRQNVEFALAGNPNPDVAALFTDVHKEAGMECMDCHTLNEMHGTGEEFNSMFEEGAMETSCDNDLCHGPGGLEPPVNTSHAIHAESVYCTSCHAQTVISCYNCHFETEIAIDKKRFYGPPPLNGFVLLVNDTRKGKVATASYQSVSYGDTTFYAVGPFGPHTITREGRECQECHDNDAVQVYTETGELPFVTWNPDEGKLNARKGVVPMPPDWEQSLLLDFVRYTGDASDPIDPVLDPTKWEFLESGADKAQMLFATALTEAQWASLRVPMVDNESSSVPGRYALLQNYPNPFNPSTTIGFRLEEPSEVTLTVFNVRGEAVRTLVSGQAMNAGTHAVALDAGGLASGVYIYRLTAGGTTLSRTMTLLR